MVLAVISSAVDVFASFSAGLLGPARVEAVTTGALFHELSATCRGIC